MKWFKHLSKSRNDALIRDAVSLFGLAGEHVYFRTLELLSDEFDIKTPGYGEFLIKSWSKNYEISVKKTIKILSFFKQKKRIFFTISGDGRNQKIKINCPKLRKLADNWTQKQIKKLRSKDGETSKQLPPIEVRSKKKEEDVNLKQEQSSLFDLPTKEEINESSLPKIKADIDRVSKELYDRKIFKDVYKFKNKMLKDGMDARALLHTLMRCYMKSSFDERGPWAYCLKIMKIESGNFREREYRKS